MHCCIYTYCIQFGKYCQQHHLQGTWVCLDIDFLMTTPGQLPERMVTSRMSRQLVLAYFYSTVTFLLSLEITGGQNIKVTNTLMFPVCFVRGLWIVSGNRVTSGVINRCLRLMSHGYCDSTRLCFGVFFREKKLTPPDNITEDNHCKLDKNICLAGQEGKLCVYSYYANKTHKTEIVGV